MNDLFSQLSVFLITHWQLSGAFIIVLGLLVGFEMRHIFNGIPQLTPQQATMLINRQEPMIVDVRDINHYMTSHIANALNIPFVDLPQGHGRLEQHKDKPILLVCAQGNQALQAAAILKKQGYQQINILKGGMQAWQSEGLPLAKRKK